VTCSRCGAPVDRPASQRGGSGCAHESFCDDCTERNLAEVAVLRCNQPIEGGYCREPMGHDPKHNPWKREKAT
jgi:hypothetical protein